MFFHTFPTLSHVLLPPPPFNSNCYFPGERQVPHSRGSRAGMEDEAILRQHSCQDVRLLWIAYFTKPTNWLDLASVPGVEQPLREISYTPTSVSWVKSCVKNCRTASNVTAALMNLVRGTTLNEIDFYKIVYAKTEPLQIDKFSLCGR
jgi:hypothetical protein